MNIRNILPIVFAFFALSIQSQNIIVEYSDDFLAKSGSMEEAFRKTILEKFENKDRVILTDGTPEKVPNYFLSTTPTVEEFIQIKEPEFIDSAGVITVYRDFGMKINSFVTLKEIESTEIIMSNRIDNSKYYNGPVSLKYSDFKMAKGSWKTMKAKAKALKIKEIKNKVIASLRAQIKKEIPEKVRELAQKCVVAVRASFPYQIKVSADESGKGKTVILDGGENFDLAKDSRLVFYTKKTVEVNGEKLYRLNYLCQGWVKSISGNKSVGRLGIGKKRVKKALKNGLEIYANEGSTPLQLPHEKREKKGLLKIAVAGIFVPPYAQQFRKDYQGKLEYSISTRDDFTLLSRRDLGKVKEVMEMQKQAGMIDNATIEQYKMEGADLLISVEVSELTLGENQFMKGYYVLNLYEVETGNLLTSKKHNINRQINSNYSETQWKQNILRTLSIDARLMLLENFPPFTQIIDIEKEKKGKAKLVVLSGGIPKDSYGKYFVYSEKTYEVNGDKLTRLTEIGEVSIQRNEGPDIFIAKVKYGGKEIYKRMLNNERLVCRKKENYTAKVGRFSAKVASKLGYKNIKD